jgi:hypothetical protein
MLAETKLKKLEIELNEVQARTTVRNLTMDEIKKAIEVAEEAVKNVRAELRPAVKLQYNPHWVAKAYNYTAEGTWLYVWFSKSGKAIKAAVSRDYVTNNPTERLVLNHSTLVEFVENELGVARPDSREALDKYNKLLLIVQKESGFNQHGTILL